MTGTATVASPVVDLEVAREFMGSALQSVREDELAGIAADLERKRQAFAAFLAPERLAAGYDAAGARRLLRSVFATRRHAGEILAADGAVSRLSVALRDLLDDARPLADRVDAFAASAPLREAFWATDLASECLHFTEPGRHWLWTRWMWDPVARTGALPLVLAEGRGLEPASPGATYLAVGHAVAHVARVVDEAGLSLRVRGPFAVDLFLVAVYAVYLYTVLRMRMTNEFTKVVPELGDLARRLLGVRGLEL